MWPQTIKNTVWLVSGEVVGRLLRAVIVVYAARVLGAAGWGTLSYMLGIAALFSIFSDIGIGAALTREMVKHPDHRAYYLSTSFYIKLTLLLLSALLIISISPYIIKLEISNTLIILTALLVTFDGLRIFTFSITRALEKMHIEALVNIITHLSIVVIGFLALARSASAESLTAAYVIGSAIGFFTILWILRFWFKNIFKKFDVNILKRILTISWPFALLGLLGGIMLNTDVVMLGWFKNAAEIGYYSASQKVVLILYTLPALISAAVFPTFIRLTKESKEDFAKILVQTLRVIFIIAIPMSIGGVILGFEFIHSLFGAEYHSAITTFRILMISLLINYPTTVIGNALFAYDKQNEIIKYSLLGAGSNVIFNLALIPVWGIEGAAVSTVLTQIITNTLIWKKMRETNEFSLKGQLNKIVLASFIMGLITTGLHLVNVNFFIIIPISAISYFTALYLLKEPALKSLLDMTLKKISFNN